MYFHHFRHLGRHLEFLKMLNDDKLSSSRILNGNVLPTRIHQEKNFIPDFQVHRKYAIFVPDYLIGKTLWKWANGLKIYDSENKWTPGAGLPPPWGNVHVYYHNIQRHSSLKPLGQSKPNFGAFLGRENERLNKWSMSHDQGGHYGYK